MLATSSLIITIIFTLKVAYQLITLNEVRNLIETFNTNIYCNASNSHIGAHVISKLRVGAYSRVGAYLRGVDIIASILQMIYNCKT